MACDSCWSDGDTQAASLIKIKRLSSGALLGQAGDNDCRGIEALLDKITDPKKLPTRDMFAATRESFKGLLALPRGGVWVISCGRVDEQGYPTDDDEDYGVWPATSMGGYAATGSGADYALSAMDAHPSVTAAKAVEVAIRRNLACRGPVHVVHLFDKNHPAPKPRKRNKVEQGRKR